MSENKGYILLFFTSLIITFPISSFSSSILTLNETNFVSIDQTLVSIGEVFELGFFSLSNSDNWYVGIWYKNISHRTYVWVANRNNPLSNSAGVFKIVGHNLVLLDQNSKHVWSSNTRNGDNIVAAAELLDSGNLVLRETRDPNLGKPLWQSFDFPTNTLLPGMKLGRDSKTGLDSNLTSWKTPHDPSSGNYTIKLNDHGLPEIILWDEVNQLIMYRSGPWDGSSLKGFGEESELFTTYEETFNSNISRNYLLSMQNLSLSRFFLDPVGNFQLLFWHSELEQWGDYFTEPKEYCELYQVCGPYATCYKNTTFTYCQCPRGFASNSDGFWHGGCVRKKKLSCNGDGFWPLSNVKFPDNATVVERNMSLKGCEKLCLKNCSCTAYANVNISNGGIACLNWFGELNDMKSYENDRNLFVRLAASEFENATLSPAPLDEVNKFKGLPPNMISVCLLCHEDRTPFKRVVTITGVLASLIIATITLMLWILRAKVREWNKRVKEMQLFQKRKSNLEFPSGSLGDRIQELPLFSFEELATATNNFDPTNQLDMRGTKIKRKKPISNFN